MQFDPTSVQAFADARISRGRSENTVRGYKADLMVLLDEYGSCDAADEFDKVACAWLNRHRAEVKPSTTCRRLSSVRAFVRYAKWYCEGVADYSPPNPGKPVPHPIPEGIDGVVEMLRWVHPWEKDRRALIAL